MAKRKSVMAMLDEEEHIAGATKAAILLLALEPGSAAAVLTHLDEDTVEVSTREIASLDMVEQEQRGRIIEEFYHTALARQYAGTGGMGLGKGVTSEQSQGRGSGPRHTRFGANDSI